MRPPSSTRPIIFGLILAIGITLTLSNFAFGAARSFGGSGRFRGSTIHRTFGAAHSSGGFRRFGAPVIQRQPSFLHDLETSGRFHRQDSFLHPFNGFGFVGVGGFSEQPVIIIQQFQPAPITEPATNRIYVQPRWVDGGHGVEVLQPGYWTAAK